ncbi:MAG: hypothetical protein H7099_12975 [Gemmatimonadaceae bacterium]|nr:hypothetical protein [Gemmatimonadaceae bacterium]
MIAWWMAQLALLGTLLAVAALGAESALKVARRQTRWVWVVAMGMTVALGAIAPTRLATAPTSSRVLDMTAMPPYATIVARPVGFMTSMLGSWNEATAWLANTVQRAWSAWHSVMPEGIERWLLITWAIASIVVLAAFLAVHIRYQRRRTHWPLGDVLGTTVRIARDTGPAVIGVTSAEIVLPQWLLTRDSAEQRLVLEHELEHVRRHDPLLLALAQVVVVLMPWHPAVWWMTSRLRLAIELDCDRRVLQRGASARDYGTLLIDLTDHRTGFGAALPAFSCTPSNLERRLVAMTPKRLKYPIARVLATGAFASLAMLAACEAKLPTSDEMDQMTASTATTAAGYILKLDTAKVTYFIDGQVATKAEAEKLAAEEIATVNVAQKGTQSGGEVRIMTRDAAKPVPGAGYNIDTTPTRIYYKRTDERAASGLPAPTRVTFDTPGDRVVLTATSDTLTRPIIKRDSESKARTGFTGLMIVDGVITDPSVVNSIPTDRILSVNVIKGVAATSQYSDPRAVNGVIQIVTKQPVKR